MTTKQVLIAARALIDAPEKWTKGESARRANGLPTTVHSPDACQFCIEGAIRTASGEPTRPLAYIGAIAAFSEAADRPCQPAFAYNDAEATTHADILGALDKAIAAC